MMPSIKPVRLLLPLLLTVVAGILLISGCRKDLQNTDPSFRLTFSNDTVLFDTVFTTIGTATQKLMVHNTSNKKVIVKTVRLARGSASPYRINIDGESAFEVHDLEIGAKDSSYIFVKVTIDPNNQDNPLIQTDSILFETNGNLQNVKLLAWGQDAYFYNNKQLSGTIVFHPGKPYVVYGMLIADSSCSLTVEAGSRLYFHDKSGLLVRNGASIRINGTLENPVTFRGDRLESFYQTVAGQWLGIELEGGSTGNRFTYADIQNGQIGLLADSSAISGPPRVELYNCIIHNMVNYGVLAIHTNILAANCQITNCGGYTVAISDGGKCDFRQCTIANYWSASIRHYSTLLLNNYNTNADGVTIVTPLENAYFGNCIISGNANEEFEADSTSRAAFDFTFDHCLLQTGQQAKFASSFLDCIVNKDAKFKDPWNGKFQLDTLSFAKDAGVLPVINSSVLDITRDLKGVSRIMDSGPDLGTYERVENK